MTRVLAVKKTKALKKVTKAIKKVANAKPAKVKLAQQKNKSPKKKPKSPVKEAKKVEVSQNHNIIPSHVIQKKREGKALTEAEIRYFADGLTKGTLPEYQMAALNMAICF